MNKSSTLLLVIGILAIATAIFFFARPSTETFSIPLQDLTVYVAKTIPQKTKGLSGIELHEFDADGMVFVYADQAERKFWMRGMKFDIDVVWIKDGKVVKIDYAVQAPEPGEDPWRMSSQPFEVDTVLELPAGKAREYGVNVGNQVKGLN